MKYSEWNNLDADQKQNTHWKHHPRIRVATIFSILFALVFAVVLLRIFKNKRVHVNRKPNRIEAFTVAKTIIKSKLKQPGTANFPISKYDAVIDTAHNLYQVKSYVNTQDSTGKIVIANWQLNMAYIGGDWADAKSWRIVKTEIKPQ